MDWASARGSPSKRYHVWPRNPRGVVHKHAIILRNKPVKRGLGVGVGVATHQLRLIQSGAVERFDFYDVSQSGLDIARNSAIELGVAERIEFICADINEAKLPRETYDVIAFIASLHHIDKLTETLSRCDEALAPGGVLWAFEYVGPPF
jgi:2-polyprenyl-3-methyl-5-hydroxy-6-metoxy-1,4-benzoquinol methylase